MSVLKLLSAASGVGGESPDVDDVFSTFLYTGTGSNQTITNGIDLSGEDGLVILKNRDGTAHFHWIDTVRGANKIIYTSLANYSGDTIALITGFNTDGFGIASTASINASSNKHVSFTFRKADKFFDLKSVSHTNGSTTTVDFSSLGTIGMGIAKRTDGNSNWFVQHRADTSKLILLDTTGAATTAESDFGIDGTNFRLDANLASGTYIVYGFAHNDDDGEFGSSGDQDIIKCGSYTGAASSSSPTIDLGFEPQLVLTRRLNSTGNWIIQDNKRNGVNLTSSDMLFPNLTNAATTSASPSIAPNSSGFTISDSGTNFNASGETYIFIAIRRGSLNEPSAASEVFKVLAPTEAQSTKLTTGFPFDLQIATHTSAGEGIRLYDRLRGVRTGGSFSTPQLIINGNDQEDTISNGTFGVDNTGFLVAGNYNNIASVFWNWKRAPNYFDIVAYSGNSTAGRTVAHNLGVAPEMIWVKKRSSATNSNWAVFHSATGNGKFLYLNTTGAASTASTYWNDTDATSSVFTLGTNQNVNHTGNTHIAYLFATLAGISKVGSYTGNGSSQTINCGFSSGSAYVLIRRTDSSGSWHVFDSARGIVAGNEQALLYNDASKVNDTDSIDPDNTGFIVNENATTNLNVSSGTYIFYAIAA